MFPDVLITVAETLNFLSTLFQTVKAKKKKELRRKWLHMISHKDSKILLLDTEFAQTTLLEVEKIPKQSSKD